MEMLLVLVHDVNTHIFEYNGELFGQEFYTLNDIKNNLEIVLSNNCKSLLVTLITILEEYLKDICLWVYNKKPVIYKSDSKKIVLAYSEIIEIGTIEDLKIKIIEKTINNIRKNNIADSFKELFIKKFKCNIPDFDTQKDDIKEISEIRNIIIHNNSIIDEKFLSRIPNRNKYHKNQKLSIDTDFLRSSIYKSIYFIKNIDQVICEKCL